MMEGIFSKNVKFTPEDIQNISEMSALGLFQYIQLPLEITILTEPYIIFQLLLHYLQQLHP